MKADDFYIRPQPYSRALRDIARLIETWESDRDCVEQIRRYLERCGVTAENRPLEDDFFL